MRPLVLLLVLCSCSNAWLDNRARTGHYSRDVYRECMRDRGADPDDPSARPKDDRRCIQIADEIYSGDGEALQAVGDGLQDAANTPGDGTVVCKTNKDGTRAVCKD